jgi:hypothetical protein
MQKYALIFTLFCCSVVQARENFTISGYVRDASTGEELIGANVYIERLKAGSTTNDYGFYSVTVPAGDYTIRYSYIGYATKEINLCLDRNIKQDIELSEEVIDVEGVVVTGKVADENIKSLEMGVTKINPVEILTIPVILGEKDILKIIQLTPGVKPAGEGNSGFYVRGGSADQNLILLDEAPVYNASHLLGFFSVFNSDAIKDVKLMKGSAPPEYGGRLSSVLDIKMNEGNSKKYAVSGGLGLISSRLTFQGPIVKNKGSFIVSGRRTYVDLFLKLSTDEDVKKSKLYFYDLNMKTNYRLGGNDRIFVSGYFGRDVFGFGETFGFDWGNATATLRWNHLFNNKLFLNSSLIYSDYNYALNIGDVTKVPDISADIQDYNLKQDFQYFINTKNMLKFGVNSIYHIFSPGKVLASDENSVNYKEIEKKYALENALYTSHKMDVTYRLKINYGLRYSLFTILGPGT